jgi:hypothetical protein
VLYIHKVGGDFDNIQEILLSNFKKEKKVSIACFGKL